MYEWERQYCLHWMMPVYFIWQGTHVVKQIEVISLEEEMACIFFSRR